MVWYLSYLLNVLIASLICTIISTEHVIIILPYNTIIIIIITPLNQIDFCSSSYKINASNLMSPADGSSISIILPIIWFFIRTYFHNHHHLHHLHHHQLHCHLYLSPFMSVTQWQSGGRSRKFLDKKGKNFQLLIICRIAVGKSKETEKETGSQPWICNAYYAMHAVRAGA